MKNDPLLDIADSVATLIAQRGYAFIEDEHVEALARALKRFLVDAGLIGTPRTRSGSAKRSV